MTLTTKKIEALHRQAAQIVRDAGPGMHDAYSPAWTADYAREQCVYAYKKLTRFPRMAAEHFENARRAVEEASAA